MSLKRRNQYDVTNTVRISDPYEVRVAVEGLILDIYPDTDVSILSEAFATYTQLYAGKLPGYHGCDTWYHDSQHSLDATLCYARLTHGHEKSVPDSEKLGARRCLLGVIIALFHDSGYIRKTDDHEHVNGAEFTLNHVGRSGDFLKWFLPKIGFAKEAEVAAHIVHFTGYEVQLERIDVKDPFDRMLGFFLGTADLLSQMADRCYLEKCRDLLYKEFEICGLAGKAKSGRMQPAYDSPEDLLRKTPAFNETIWNDRLDGYFEGCYKYLDVHAGGPNPYVREIKSHMQHLQDALDDNDFSSFRRRYKVINAEQLSGILNITGHQSELSAQH